MTPVFSINAASELLERDRRTVTKALRHTPPDRKEKGQPRWKLPTILAALDALPGTNNSGPRRRGDNVVVNNDWLDPANWRDSRIRASIIEFNETFSEMKAIKDIEQRRAFAIAKLIAYHDKNFRGWETDNPAPGRFWNDTDSVCARTSLLWTQQMEAAADACGWTHDEGREFLGEHFDDEDD